MLGGFTIHAPWIQSIFIDDVTAYFFLCGILANCWIVVHLLMFTGIMICPDLSRITGFQVEDVQRGRLFQGLFAMIWHLCQDDNQISFKIIKKKIKNSLVLSLSLSFAGIILGLL